MYCHDDGGVSGRHGFVSAFVFVLPWWEEERNDEGKLPRTNCASGGDFVLRGVSRERWGQCARLEPGRFDKAEGCSKMSVADVSL